MRHIAYGKQYRTRYWKYIVKIWAEPKFERGYTFHEQLTEFDLINMNGRIYDPFIARFMSPDPFTQDPGNLQGYNRYSYVLNNPMKYVDPSGYKTYHWEEPVWNYEAANFAGGGAGSYNDGFNWPKFGTLHGPKNAFEYDLMLSQQVDKEFGILSNTEAVMNDANQGYYPAYQLKKSNLIYHTGKYRLIGSSVTTWEDGTAVVTQDIEPIYAVKSECNIENTNWEKVQGYTFYGKNGEVIYSNDIRSGSRPREDYEYWINYYTQKNIQLDQKIRDADIRLKRANKRLKKLPDLIIRLGLRTSFWWLPMSIPDAGFDIYFPLDESNPNM